MNFSSPPFTSPVTSRPIQVPTSPRSTQDEPVVLSDDGSDNEFFATQPTQIASQKNLRRSKTPPLSSPKPEIVEVPASSPFQQPPPKPAAGRLASMMAPAGTLFRAPPKLSPPPKRKLADLVSDDELVGPINVESSSDDDQPARGDIQPSFLINSKRQQTNPPSTITARPEKRAAPRNEAFSAAAESRTEQIARRMLKNNKVDKYSLEQYKRALRAKGNNSAAALAALREGLFCEVVKKEATPAPVVISSSSSSVNTPASSPSHPSSSASSQPPRSPSPKTAKRRLQQGRKLQQVVLKPKKSRVVHNVDDDDDGDGYDPEKDASRSKDESTKIVLSVDHEAKVLEYLNTCSITGLQASAKLKKDEAAHMITKRPFLTVEMAQAVNIMKTKRGKRSRYPLGEDVVSEITEFISTLNGIDSIIRSCERQGEIVQSNISKWRMDQTGKTAASSSTYAPLPYSAEPSSMQGHCTMQSYQLFGMNWMWQLYEQKFGAILADDMGLGKTCQVVSFMGLLVDNYDKGLIEGDQPWPNLVVVPPSTLANWKNEFERFAPNLSIITYSGSQTERNQIAYEIESEPSDYHVILTSYSQLNREEDIAAMKTIGPHVAVYDEGHKMKNPLAKIYKDMNKIKADWRIILTGTPIQNNIMEMVSLLKFINPGLFRHHNEAVTRLFVQKLSLEQVSQGAVLVSERVTRARSILEPFILQRKKEHVLTTMPPKTRKVVYCDLYEDQAAIYGEYEKIFKRDKTVKIRTNGRKNDQNNVWVQLRKAAGHPQLFRRYFDDKKVEQMAKTLMDCVSQDELRQPNLQHLIDELKQCSDFALHLWCRDYRCLRKFDCPEGSWLKSGKVERLLQLLGEYQKNGDRVLVFSRFALVIDILQECLASAGVKHHVLKGETAVSERQTIINKFNEDKSITAFLLTTGAGGTGINLTAANKVILFDQSDNPQDDIQAENRAHRLGQEREVEVIRFLSRGTIDELVYRACQKKLELAGKITGYMENISSEDMASLDIDIEAEVRKELARGAVGE